MSILDYSKLTHILYKILQKLSSFIDWAENWRYRYIENSFHIHIANKLTYNKKIKK